MARQTFRTDPLSISTLENVILWHSTAIWSDLTCSLPFGMSSSSILVLVLTICLYSCLLLRSLPKHGTRSRSPREQLDGPMMIAGDNMENCAGNLSAIPLPNIYSYVLMNSTILSSPTLFFCGSSIKMSFPFFFFSSLSAKSLFVYLSCSSYPTGFWILLALIFLIVRTSLITGLGLDELVNFTKFETRNGDL